MQRTFLLVTTAHVNEPPSVLGSANGYGTVTFNFNLI
jgi:hypothetical protein